MSSIELKQSATNYLQRLHKFSCELQKIKINPFLQTIVYRLLSLFYKPIYSFEFASDASALIAGRFVSYIFSTRLKKEYAYVKTWSQS